MGEPESLRRELILYATPNGELADQIKEFEARITSELGATTAQAYPPHVTLTGFFFRTPTRADELISDAAAVIAGLIDGDLHDTRIVDLALSAPWVGLEIVSPAFERIAAEVAARDQVTPGDDAIRLKDGLHLSLAYGELGDGNDLSSYGELAREVVDVHAKVGWDLAIWERTSRANGPPRWTQHGEIRWG